MSLPSRIESDGEIVARLGVDAEKWAAEFASVVERLIESGMPLDCVLDGSPGNLVHAWFVNAMDVARTAGYADAERGAAAVSKTENKEGGA